MVIGTICTASGAMLGAYLVQRTYMEVTQSHLVIEKLQSSNTNTNTVEPEGYDWDEYDAYTQGKNEEEVPEA
jgi:hypothetical protein